ncbi:MAG: hypothetical protein WD294_00820 [Phycisphaeraceae bacterium]
MSSLSPKSLASAMGVSESSVKRWADEGHLHVSRTAGGHRRIEVTEALRYIRETGLPVVDPRPLGLAAEATFEQPRLSDRENGEDAALAAAIESGDAEQARVLATGMYLAGRSTAAICDGPLTQAMQSVGPLYQEDPDGICVEHRATDVCFQTLHELRRLTHALRQPEPHRPQPLAIGGAPGKSQHLLPSLMVASVLEAEDWRAVNFGASLPIASLCRAVHQHRPQVVWLSISMRNDRPGKAEMSALLHAVEAVEAELVIGGRAARRRRVDHRWVEPFNTLTEFAAYLRGCRQHNTMEPA